MIGSNCAERVSGLKCHRDAGHGGAHQAAAFEDDGHHGLQLVEWWSIKPNGDPVEVDRDGIKTTCQQCQYTWFYSGSKEPGPYQYTSCPQCNTTVKVGRCG